MLSSAAQSSLVAKARIQAPTETDASKLQVLAGKLVTPAVGDFFTNVYKPATTTLTPAAVNTFIDARTGSLKELEREAVTAYFLGQASVASSGYLDALAEVGQTAGYTTPPGSSASSSSSSSSGPAPVCGGGLVFDSEGMCVSSETTPFSCPSGYEQKETRCVRIGGTETTDPVCPAGKSYSAEYGGCQSTPIAPTCPGGYEYKDKACVLKAADTATGGTTVTAYGPTAGGGTSRSRQVFGPVFTSAAAPIDGQGAADTSSTNVYPELLGGGASADTTTRIPGVGVTSPSKSWTLMNNGSLPALDSEQSRYFAYSRQPGDLDVIPDPYRVAQSFSQASYSSKTEPVPFLTDFSAFLK
jgi:hypothetical protein